jgi:hypothetical protein
VAHAVGLLHGRIPLHLRGLELALDEQRAVHSPDGLAPRLVQLPLLRRVVSITDHDSGAPVTHTLELLRTRRVDTYAVKVDGQPWRQAGWSAVLAMLRKAYPRIPSPRSTVWQT